MFNIPVVLFLFRRADTLPKIIGRIGEVKPQKIYLLADAGRNEKEQLEAEKCRAIAESLITWDCEVIKHYAKANRGVYKNIGEGAKWVFGRESRAIFIEDDNLPEISFFRYAEELLEKYYDEDKVLWICGTNYVTDMESVVSYTFTKHLLPCGWASWSNKFLKYYDGELKGLNDRLKRQEFFRSYRSKVLALYQYQSILNENYRYQHTGKFLSWDFQMLWSIRSNNLVGIVPMRNQITNIGVDDFSIHGGNSKTNVMTDRFCEIPSKELLFPLIHPQEIMVDEKSEDTLGRIICPPKKRAIKSVFGSKIKHLMKKDSNLSFRSILHGKK